MFLGEGGTGNAGISQNFVVPTVPWLRNDNSSRGYSEISMNIDHQAGRVSKSTYLLIYEQAKRQSALVDSKEESIFTLPSPLN